MAAALHRDHCQDFCVIAPRSFSVERSRPWDDETRRIGQLMMGHSNTRTLDLFEGACTPLRSELDGLEELESHEQLPCGWERYLDLQTGVVYYKNRISGRTSSIEPREREGKAQGSERVKTHESPEEAGSMISETKLDLTLNLGNNDNIARKVKEVDAGDQCATQEKHSELGTHEERESTVRATEQARVSNSIETSMSWTTSSTSILSQELVATEMSSTCAKSRKSPRGSEDDENQNMEIVGCPGCLMYVMRCVTEDSCPVCGSSKLVHFPWSPSNKRLRTN